jgi:hypothetical protein
LADTTGRGVDPLGEGRVDVDGTPDSEYDAPASMAMTASWTRLPVSGPTTWQPRMRSVDASTTRRMNPRASPMALAFATPLNPWAPIATS